MTTHEKKTFFATYDWAKNWQDLPWAHDEPTLFLAEITRRRKPGKALDIGCGAGTDSVFLAKQGWDVTALDFMPKALEYTQQRAREAGDVDGLTNPSNRTCFVYSQGCMAGGFDSGDCIAEHFTVKTTHAAFAVIMNARYGFFWSYSTDGDSQRLHRQFWDAVFGEMMSEIGKASHYSKEDNLPIIGRSCIRWVYYETNLFGDPAVKITEISNNPPTKPSLPSGPTSGKVGVDYTCRTSSTDPDSDALLYYQWSWGDEESAWLGPYPSGQSIQTIHKWLAAGDYQVKVKVKDNYGATSAWSDPITVQIVEGPQIEIGNISGGMKITVEIKNIGVFDASHVNWTITVQGLVLIGQEKSGTRVGISPGGSLDVSTGLVFGLGSVDITITAMDVQKTATAFLLGPFILNVK